MRLLHTSDWHLGKSLEGHSRIEEQTEFLKDFLLLADEKKVDMVIIAGDIFDTFNPPAIAERLFNDFLVELSKDGSRVVVVIAGNHDSPDRLETIKPLVEDKGIIIMGYPTSKAQTGTFKSFEIIEALEGFTKIKIKNELINLITLPYPNESRLNEIISELGDDAEMQKSYSKKINDIFLKLEENLKDDEINIATSHLFVTGSEISDSERRIELGGSLLVEKNHLPKKVQYMALGHIHKPQKVSSIGGAYYSGSPIQYSKSEKNIDKIVKIVDLEAGKEAKIENEKVKTYKEICVFKCKSIEEALEICENRKDDNIYSYFEIETETSIDLKDMNKMKSLLKNIIEIRPVNKNIVEDEVKKHFEINSSNITSLFIDFYKKEKDLEPPEKVIDLFKKIVSEEEDSNETH